MKIANKLNALIAAVIFLLSLLVFSQTLRNDFVWDSKAVIIEENRTNSITESLRFFSEAYTISEEEETSGLTAELRSVEYYRPFLGIFHALEKKLFDTTPLPYKAVNLFLNAVVSVLAFFSVLELTKNRMLSALSAALFSFNPTKAEVVYWVYSDSHLFVAVFLLSSFLFYSKRKPLLACASFLAALFSQENAVLLPFILFAYERILGRRTFKQDLLSVAPFVALAVIYLAIRHFVVGEIPIGSFGILETLIAIAILIQRYVRIYIFTSDPVTAYRLVPEILNLENPEACISLLLLALFLAVAAYFWWRKHASAFWCAWFLIWLSVSLNVGSLGDYFMAEKPLYLSGLGLCVLLSGGLLAVSKNKAVTVSLVLALSAVHAKQSYSRGSYWKDTVTYLEAALTYDPDFAFYSHALGVAYCEENRHDDAIRMFSGLLDRKGENVYYRLGIAEAYFALGNHLFKNSGDTDAAIQAYRKSLDYEPRQARIYNNLGNIHLTNEEHLTAIGYYRQALALEPEHFKVYYNLALALEAIGDHANAAKYFQKFNQSIEKSGR